MASVQWVFNFANAILGVSLLALPYCFKECGIILSIFMILLCGYVTKVTCEYLLRTANFTRQSSYESIAFHLFGPIGKFATEFCTIGLVLGILISYQIVIGDLAPSVVYNLVGIQNSPKLRAILMVISNFAMLPLCMMKQVSSLSAFNFVTVAFYILFMFIIFWYALSNMLLNSFWDKVDLWNSYAIFRCLPMIAMAFSCQTQVLMILSALPDPTMKAMVDVINSAINLSATLYIGVGLFGYLAFYPDYIYGDILDNFAASFISDFIKLGFWVTGVLSFPLILFPARTAINSILFHKQRENEHRDSISTADDYIASDIYTYITLGLVFGTLIIGILVPNIEVVLTTTGAVIGIFLCYIFPSGLFIVASGNEKMKRGAQVILLVSVASMIFSTQAIITPVHPLKAKSDAVKLTETTPLRNVNIEIDNIGIDRHLNTYIDSNELALDSENAVKVKKVNVLLNDPHGDFLLKEIENNDLSNNENNIATRENNMVNQENKILNNEINDVNRENNILNNEINVVNRENNIVNNENSRNFNLDVDKNQNDSLISLNKRFLKQLYEMDINDT
ncbi:putative sodium-coupled neutral amino acid transporter 10 isoform X1 [Hydra vulgaris]|uniref:Putative sodium-coupled neutral amino acid transporter 10 n=1 Tax=Hydra vulgaris TaxID=6087 RepID=T2M4M2_HYDVU|nr:putative sodium-coupled neutral amino acid transporter 10 isoform X1 [Hydra vulgaris]